VHGYTTELQDWVIVALKATGGAASIVEVAKAHLAVPRERIKSVWRLLGNALGQSMASASSGHSTRNPSSVHCENEMDRQCDAA
jgi:hypothetical protein